MGTEFGPSWNDFYNNKYGEINSQTALSLALDIVDALGVDSLDDHPEREKIVKAICLMTDADLINWSNGGRQYTSPEEKVKSFERRIEKARGLRDVLRAKMNYKKISPQVN